jgi:mRNA deadenylase 3'-5' endonuclease subunit Ccr4
VFSHRRTDTDHPYAELLDGIYHTRGSLPLLGSMQIASSEDAIDNAMMPNARMPSDHMPVGATFYWA